MKKFIVVFLAFILLLSMASCNKGGQDEFDIVKAKEIVLGKEVDSVVIETSEGEEITCDKTADFYEIFDKIGFVNYKAGKKLSCVAETKLGDESKSYVNMNAYYLDSAELYEFRAKKEGDDAVLVVEEYNYSKKLEDNSFEMSSFSKYTYKDEKALNGSESGANGVVRYSSKEYPIFPTNGTELCEMQARAVYLRNLISQSTFFKNYEPYELNDKTYDINEFVTREYKLYENYIVFKQTAPFFNIPSGVNKDFSLLYASISNSDCSITQEAYYNLKTGEVELVKLYGATSWHTVEYYGRKIEINLLLYIHKGDEAEYNQKVDALKNYVKSNAN